jgi:hypothetical protein
MFVDPIQFADVVQKYALGVTLTIRLTHLEGEEIFGSYKQKLNLLPRSKGDSHQHGHVNFCHPCVNT